jgi:hypothetical protein
MRNGIGYFFSGGIDAFYFFFLHAVIKENCPSIGTSGCEVNGLTGSIAIGSPIEERSIKQ